MLYTIIMHYFISILLIYYIVFDMYSNGNFIHCSMIISAKVSASSNFYNITSEKIFYTNQYLVSSFFSTLKIFILINHVGL